MGDATVTQQRIDSLERLRNARAALNERGYKLRILHGYKEDKSQYRVVGQTAGSPGRWPIHIGGTAEWLAGQLETELASLDAVRLTLTPEEVSTLWQACYSKRASIRNGSISPQERAEVDRLDAVMAKLLEPKP